MVSAEIRNQLKQQILDEGLTPKLSIIIVGNRVDSATYVRMETKACNEVGILTEDIKENPQNQIAESSRRTHTDWDNVGYSYDQLHNKVNMSIHEYSGW